MSPPGRPKGEYRSAQHEGSTVSLPGSTPAQALNVLAQMPPAQSAALFDQLGLVTQRLQAMLGQLDALPRLQRSAQALPVARGRLDEVAQKNFQAADTVLGAVEQAQQERACIAAAARRLQQPHIAATALRADALHIEAAASRLDTQLTDILVAQSFHDLSGQMLAKVAALAMELESGLVQLLPGSTAPASAGAAAPLARDQHEVDELLASHGL
jgi:chemotaxis protein CheZ